MRTALALVLLLATHDVASSKCMRALISSDLVTRADTKLAADGAILIGVTSKFEGTARGADTGLNPTWRFTDGTTQYEPVLATLAPGLVTYRPPAGVTGALSLVDGKTTIGKVTITTDKPATLDAPDVKAVMMSHVREVRGGTRLQLDAAFKTGAPADAIAVVVFLNQKAGNVARSWVRVAPGAKAARAAGSAGRCDPGIPGEVMSRRGDKIVLAWVDTHGRLSKLSRPITVQGAK